MAEKTEGSEGSDVERVGHTKQELEVASNTSGGLRTVEAGLTPSQVVSAVDKETESRILRKIDYRLVPLLAFLYL